MIVALIAMLLAQAPAWNTFPSTESKAAIQTPCVMERNAAIEKASPGVSFFNCVAASGEEMYFFAWTDIKTAEVNAPVEMRAARDATLKGYTLLTSDDRPYQGLPAMTFNGNGQGRFISSRVVVSNRRMYQLMVAIPLDKDHASSVQRFLDSLSLN